MQPKRKRKKNASVINAEAIAAGAVVSSNDMTGLVPNIRLAHPGADDYGGLFPDVPAGSELTDGE